MTGLLASVRNLAEARLVHRAGADIIDLKQPSEGALGAQPVAEVREIVTALGGCRPISATIGDLPMAPGRLRAAVAAMAETGVHYVKVGFFPGGDWEGSIRALSDCAAGGVKLIAVLFADRAPDLGHIPRLAAAGFTGVMLDTLDKSLGSLRAVYSEAGLATFVESAFDHALLCGLAGSLRAEDVEPLLTLAPDYLGFRGALCRGRERTEDLDPAAIRRIRARIDTGSGGRAFRA